MSIIPTIKNYTVQIHWDERAGYFVAEVPDIPTCSADGTTPAEAIANLEQTFAVMKEAYVEEAMTLPPPNPNLPISIEELSDLTDLVKISRLAELAGISGQTLASKLKRGTEFSVIEARKIAQALGDQGLALRSKDYPTPSDEKLEVREQEMHSKSRRQRNGTLTKARRKVPGGAKKF